ncbi:MAG TPA: hypothetical protein VIL81_05250 [Candidatus Limnocylindrales bacterium]|jgi:hypothetical protein
MLRRMFGPLGFAVAALSLSASVAFAGNPAIRPAWGVVRCRRGDDDAARLHVRRLRQR